MFEIDRHPRMDDKRSEIGRRKSKRVKEPNAISPLVSLLGIGVHGCDGNGESHLRAEVAPQTKCALGDYMHLDKHR